MLFVINAYCVEIPQSTSAGPVNVVKGLFNISRYCDMPIYFVRHRNASMSFRLSSSSVKWRWVFAARLCCCSRIIMSLTRHRKRVARISAHDVLVLVNSVWERELYHNTRHLRCVSCIVTVNLYHGRIPFHVLKKNSHVFQYIIQELSYEFLPVHLEK